MSRLVRLKSKTLLALGLASVAAMAGLLPGYLTLSGLEAQLADVGPSGHTATSADALPLQDQLRLARLGLSLGAACVLGTLAVLAVIALNQIKALRDTASGMARIGAGDLAPPPPLDQGDEIGDLSRALARMVAAWAQTSSDLASEHAIHKETAERYRALAHLAADFIWETDANGRMISFSGTVPEGIDPQTVIGRPLSVLMSVDIDGAKTRPIDVTCCRPLRNLLCAYTTDDGVRRYCQLSGEAITDDDGGFLGFRGVGQDVTNTVEAEESAHAGAFKDPLTGLANQSLIKERIHQAMVARAGSDGEVAVIQIGLDGFKGVNDRFGEAMGDAVLRDVAQRLTACIGPRDTVARIGGDRFVMLQSEGAQPTEAERLCRTILLQLRVPFTYEGQSVSLTASLGCALTNPHAIDAHSLLTHADLAMHRAKNDGGDTFRFHEKALTSALQSRLCLERDLRKAIERGGIEVHYEPLMQAAARRLIGFEATLRWPRAGHGMVYPNAFLPLAEDTGLSVPLTAQMLNTACQTAASWPDLRVTVPLSPAAFHDGALHSTVSESLRNSGLSPEHLVVTVTEAAVVGSEDAALFRIDALHELGVRVGLEGFGIGLASLQHLQRCPFDLVKLHARFVAHADRDVTRTEMVRSVVQIAAALGIETAAEGVSHEGQAVHLSKLGCETLQGPCFGTALTAPRCISLIRSAGLLRDTLSAVPRPQSPVAIAQPPSV